MRILSAFFVPKSSVILGSWKISESKTDGILKERKNSPTWPHESEKRDLRGNPLCMRPEGFLMVVSVAVQNH